MVHISDIDSLTNFKRDTPRFIRRMARSKKPMALTVNGKAKLVVMDAAAYEGYEDYLEYTEAMKAVRQGLADVKAGRTRSADDVFDDIFRLLDAKKPS